MSAPSGHSGSGAIVAALGANLGIAVLKFLAFALTRSSSMLAEGIHSVADSGNQVLLLVGGRASQKQADEEHPFGYGRNRYIYAFIVSIIIFALGGLFALYEGYEKLHDPHGITEWQWVPVVLLLEDAGALLGLMFALFGVGMTLLTGNGLWDAFGTLAIGVLLVFIAVFLAVEMKSLILGEAASAEDLAKIRAAIEDGDSERIIHIKTVHLGPEEILVAAKIRIHDADTGRAVADEIDAAEVRIREAVPAARIIYLEPDILRADA